MKKTIFILFLIVMNSTYAFFPLVGEKSCTPRTNLPGIEPQECGWEDFIQAIRNVISAIVNISGILALIFVLYGGFLIMFGGPSPGNVHRGHEVIKIALFGYILVLISLFIIDLLLEFFQVKEAQ